jgi:hypothetical protein
MELSKPVIKLWDELVLLSLVAMTLIEKGRKFIGVETALKLDQGVERLRRLIEERRSWLRSG